MELTEEERDFILKGRRAAKQKKAKGFVPRKLADISPSEKEKKFDELFHMVREEYAHVVEHGRESKDFEHWCFEEMMMLLGTKVFDGYNAYCD